MRKGIIRSIAVLTSMFILAGCGSAQVNKETTKALEEITESFEETTEVETEEVLEEETKSIEYIEDVSGKYLACIDIEGYGIIEVELDADVAPKTVANFVSLANSGFYDGLTFHRIIDGFMMQGGDPTATGFGGSDRTIEGEFASNGHENNISHVRGTISMARSQPYDSASSQFFIVHQDSTFLDGDYAAFGKVVSGMEIVDSICENTPVIDTNGTVREDSRPVIKSITISKGE